MATSHTAVRATTQEVPLRLARILRHGSTVHGRTRITTWTGEDAPTRRTFAEFGTRAAQLAYALEALHVETGDAVGALMWNNAEHGEGYFAVPQFGSGSAPSTCGCRPPAGSPHQSCR